MRQTVPLYCLVVADLLAFIRWRSPTVSQGRDPEDAFGFLDGDLLQRFRTFPDVEKAAILRGKNEFERLNVDEGKIRTWLEQLNRLH